MRRAHFCALALAAVIVMLSFAQQASAHHRCGHRGLPWPHADADSDTDTDHSLHSVDDDS